MKHTKIVLISEYGNVDQLYIDHRDIHIPTSNEVLIKVVATSVNPVDIKIRSGSLKEWLPLTMPVQLGTDFSGIVEAVGEGVFNFKIGDRVAGFSENSEIGTYAEYIIIPTSNVVLVPDELDLIDIAAAPTGVLTGTQLIELSAKVKAGDRVLVTGANGSVGRAAVLAAIDAGALVYAGVRKSRISSIADLQVHAIIDIEDESSLKTMGSIDVIADTVGGEVIANLHKYLRPNGRISSIVVPMSSAFLLPTVEYNSHIVVFDAKRLSMFFNDMIHFKRKLPIAKRMSLDEVKEAHQLFMSGKLEGKIILLP